MEIIEDGYQQWNVWAISPTFLTRNLQSTRKTILAEMSGLQKRVLVCCLYALGIACAYRFFDHTVGRGRTLVNSLALQGECNAEENTKFQNSSD